ncbi:TorF family putative porin [Asticcacaulis sp. AC402]|uniref:TorF family putative porin n=1 Tax=Asticcacaulis sp. AC402 TaxID=1282361 RepID=UPI0003C3BF4B|nr:TorF family putative porin [Asticcacaulis sp. AC402]ESQ75322.1 hypothetical protein ABAC402_09460 [Asticcacaulis sp. AC402]
MKKTLLVAAVALSALFAGAASAQDAGELSFNIAATNNYVWRGVTQTDDNAALQGGVDYKKGMYYVGAWGSNVDFGADTASTEVDLYAGITPSAGDFSFDFGYIHYFYPDQSDNSDFDFGELKAAVSHPMGAGSIGFAMYLPAEDLEDPYYEVNASQPIGDKWTVSGAIGNYEAAGYSTWNVGVTYAITDALSLDVRYSDAGRPDVDPIDVPSEDLPDNIYATLKVGF